MNYRFGVVFDLETDKLIQSAKAAEEEINRLEKAIIDLRKQKLNTDDTKEIAIKIKQIKENTIALAEQRLKLRTLNKDISENVFIQKQAAKAQADFTRQVTTSKAGIEAINNVLGQFKAQVEDGGDELAALKSQLVALQRLKYSGVLNAADQKVLRKEIFETNVRIREQAQALRVQQSEARKAALESKKLSASQQQFRSQVGASNAVALEFNRIIQDAPFGIIGVGNNIQQLASQFQFLKGPGVTTAQALKQSLASIIAPTNLVVLGISALTSALTAYQLGLFGSSEATNDLKDAQDALNDSLKETDKIARANFYNKILQDIGLLRFEVDETGKALGAVPTNLPFEEQLNIISERIKKATKPELEALAQFLKENYQDSVRAGANATSDLEKQLAKSRSEEYYKQLQLVNQQLDFYKDKTEKATKANKDLIISEDELIKSVERSNQIREDSLKKLDQLLSKKQIEQPNIDVTFTPNLETASELGGMTSLADLSNQIASLEKLRNVTTDPEAFQRYNEQIRVLRAELDLLSGNKSPQLLIDTFSALGSAIGNALDISNDALRGFVSTLLSNTPKIIQAILAQSRINKQVSRANVQASAQEAGADAVVIGTKAAKALGPVGLALLPVFVGGALALISNAFRGTGARVNSSAGAGAASSAVRSNAVGSSITGFGQAANPFGDLTLRTSIRGTDIELLLERVNVKSNA